MVKDQIMFTDDLLSLVAHDTTLRRVADSTGGYYAGSCPFCGGTDRFRVWPNHPDGPRWWCANGGRNGCGRGGDTIAYLVERGDITKAEAYRLRHKNHVDVRATQRKAKPVSVEVKEPTWNAGAALAVVAECEAALWTNAGEKAREWLHERGLQDKTLRSWRIGFNPASRKVHGLWVERGIVIPCFVDDGTLWYLKVRRPVPGSARNKYVQVKGGSNHVLFGLDHLTGKRAAVVCEAELDAILLYQEAGDLVDVVATGSATGRPAPRFLARLLPATTWLVALDNDRAGEQGYRWWREQSARVRRVRPLQGGDLTDFYRGGGDLQEWIRFQAMRFFSG